MKNKKKRITEKREDASQLMAANLEASGVKSNRPALEQIQEAKAILRKKLQAVEALEVKFLDECASTVDHATEDLAAILG